jgi:hypothetical protein
MTTRIVRIEKFIPRVGSPVFQVHEESDLGDGRVVLLDPRNPTADELKNADEAFAASQQSRISELESELASANQSIEAKTQELSTLTTSRDSLQSQLTQANESAAAKDTTIAENAATIAALQARVASLLEGLPWNPRIMEATAFVKRISTEEMLLLGASDDPQIKAIVQMLAQWKQNTKDWPIILDSPEMQQAIGYLGLVGMVTPERVAEILRDCTREESFVADGN